MTTMSRYPTMYNTVLPESDSVHHFSQYWGNVKKKEYIAAQDTLSRILPTPAASK